MKRGSLRCELDSATPSGLQQAAIGGTGAERVRPCRQSPVRGPGGRSPAHNRTPPTERNTASSAARPLAVPRAPPALIGCATPRPLLKGLRQLTAARRRATPPARPMTSRQAQRSPQIAHWPSHLLVIVAVPPLEQRESPPGIH